MAENDKKPFTVKPIFRGRSGQFKFEPTEESIRKQYPPLMDAWNNYLRLKEKAMAMFGGSWNEDNERPMLTDQDKEILRAGRRMQRQILEELDLREKHPPLMEAWEKYQMLLKIYQSNSVSSKDEFGNPW